MRPEHRRSRPRGRRDREATSLDHFGTGHGSLTQLRRIRLDRLKIDRSLGHEVVADGVETEDRLDVPVVSGAPSAGSPFRPSAAGARPRAPAADRPHRRSPPRELSRAGGVSPQMKATPEANPQLVSQALRTELEG